MTKEYPDDVPIRNSGPTGIPLRRVPKATKKVAPRPPTYLPPFKETKRILVTKDARRIWEAAEQLDLEWSRERQRAPPSDETQAQFKKEHDFSVHEEEAKASYSSRKRAGMGSQGYKRIAKRRSNYPDNLTTDLREQFHDPYELNEEETFAINKTYARDLEAQLPLPKVRI